MRKILLIAALAVGLAGCAQITTAWNALTGATVSPQAVYIAANAFDAVELTATNYLRLPRCHTGGPVICRSPSATAQIVPAVRSGRVARNNLEQFMKDHPGQLGPQGLYDALTGATATLKGIFAQYNIGAH